MKCSNVWSTGLTKQTDERLKQIGQKVSKKMKGRQKSTAHKEHIKIGVTTAWTDAQYRKNHEIATQRSHTTTAYRKLASAALTLAHADPTKYQILPLDTPVLCNYCGDEINLTGICSEGVVFHSLDGNHENWDPANKVPVHRKCHPRVHKEIRKTRRKEE